MVLDGVHSSMVMDGVCSSMVMDGVHRSMFMDGCGAQGLRGSSKQNKNLVIILTFV